MHYNFKNSQPSATRGCRCACPQGENRCVFCRSHRKHDMAIRFVAIIMTVFGAVATAAEPPVSPAQGPIRLTTQQQPPYNMESADGQQKGIALEVVRCALEKMQRPFTITFYPWLRAQNRVRDQLADGFFPAVRNSDRDLYAELSVPFAPQQWRWYFKADQPLNPHGAAFKRDAIVGAYHGSAMLNWLKDEGYTVLASPHTHDQLLRMLLNNRVQAVLASDLAMNTATQVLALVDARHVVSVLERDNPMGVYFGKHFLAQEGGQFMPKFNAAIAACLAASGGH